MARRFTPRLAVSLIFAAATLAAAAGIAALSSPAVACDCTNCSAEHCQPKRKGNVEYTWKVEEGEKSSSKQLKASASRQTGTARGKWKSIQGGGVRIHE